VGIQSLITTFVFTTSLFGAAASARVTSDSPSVEAIIVGGKDPWPTFLSHLKGFNSIDWGIELEGVAPLSQNESLAMVPASVQKLVTTASAFKNLGADAKFENYFDGSFANETASHLKFTISGDPTWGHPEYESFDARLNLVVAELRAKGIRHVTGDIEIVSTRPELDTIAKPDGWPARWTLECMATMPSTFMINGNCGEFRVISPTRAQWLTPGVDLPIHLNLSTGRANDLVIEPELDSLGRITGYTVSGKFRTAASLGSVPVYFGTRWLKNLFLASLTRNGISYSADDDEVSGESLHVDLSSQPLRDILKKAVQESINAILDRTFFEIAHVLNLKEANSASYEVLREVVNDDSLMDGVEMDDGCGLNVNDRMRADTMRAFLAGLRSQDYFPDFLSVLAVAGVSGTLADRLTGPLTRGKVFGKTGTIDDFYNLVGYFQTPTKNYEPFVLFTSSKQSVYEVKDLIDEVVTEFAALNTHAAQ
jgi:D-alanyl-D-alanine carboxypeptidase/D-alanyl-D-alanine-endopeptidase (penicillin-binding protein 4)